MEVPPKGVCLNLPTYLTNLTHRPRTAQACSIENPSMSSSTLPWWLEDDDDGDLRCCILPMTHE